MLAWADRNAPGRRVWALEGRGSFAAGLAIALAEAGEDIVEISGSKRTRGAKNDRIDAVRAARTALAREQQAEPRARGLREALRQILVTRHAVLVSRTKAINELKSLIVIAPEHLRASLRGLPLATQLQRIAALNSPAGATVEHRITVLTLRSIAARIGFLLAQTAELDSELATLVKGPPRRTRVAGRTRRRTSRRGPTARELVAPRTRPRRSRLRLPRWRRTLRSQQRASRHITNATPPFMSATPGPVKRVPSSIGGRAATSPSGHTVSRWQSSSNCSSPAPRSATRQSANSPFGTTWTASPASRRYSSTYATSSPTRDVAWLGLSSSTNVLTSPTTSPTVPESGTCTGES